MHDPRAPHFHFLKRILRYLKGYTEIGLTITPSHDLSLTTYSDADLGGCPDTRRSTSGYCVILGSSIVSWSSKRQLITSRSSAEAEYRVGANAVAETTWLRQLLCDLGVPPACATLVCDNVSAVTCRQIQFITSAPNILRLIFILLGIRLLWVFFGFFMFLLVFSSPIFSPMDYLLLFFGNLFPISMFALLPFRLWGF